MPGSTPSPAPLGKTSVYQGTKKPHFSEEFLQQQRIREEQVAMARSQGMTEDILQTGNTPNNTYYSTQMRKSQQKAVTKAISQLPYATREQVESFVNMALDTAESSSKDLESTRREVKKLRLELGKKTQEGEMAQKNIFSLRQKLATAESNLETMGEDLLAKQRFHLKNKHVLDKVSNTNRLLVNSIEALGGEPDTSRPTLTRNDTTDSHGSHNNSRRGLLKPIDSLSSNMFDSGKGGESSKDLIIRPSTSEGASRPGSREDGGGGGVGRAITADGGDRPASGKLANTPGDTGSEKLRESLLRVTRQHLISQKANTNLDKEIMTQRKEIRALEVQNRALKSELDELKSVRSTDSPSAASPPPTNTIAPRLVRGVSGDDGDEDGKDERGNVEKGRRRNKVFGKIDQRFEALLRREALAPEEGLMYLRRCLEYCQRAPTQLNTEDIISYATGPGMTKVFDVDSVILVLKPSPNSFEPRTDVLFKYTPRSNKPEILEEKQYTKSICGRVIRNQHTQRLNGNLGRNHYNKEIDSVTGLGSRRLMCTPLYNSFTGDCLGCIMLVNKQNAGDAFAEVDELMHLVVCDQFAFLLTQCYEFERSLQSMNVYRDTLESSIHLYNTLPAPDSPLNERDLDVATVINGMEEVATRTLKCQRVRVFLVSAHIKGREPGNLVYITPSDKARGPGNVSTITPLSSIAGQVFTSRESVEVMVDDGEMKSRLNPLADLDVTTKPLVTVPILDAEGDVYAVMQLVPGERSPHFSIRESMSTTSTIGNKVVFTQAAQWLAYCVSQATMHLMSFISRKPAVPAWYPLSYSAMQIAPFQVNAIEELGEEDEEEDGNVVGDLPHTDPRKVARQALKRRARGSRTTLSISQERDRELARLEDVEQKSVEAIKGMQSTLDSKEAEFAEALKKAEEAAAARAQDLQSTLDAATAEASKLAQAKEALTVSLESQKAATTKAEERAAEFEAKAMQAEAELLSRPSSAQYQAEHTHVEQAEGELAAMKSELVNSKKKASLAESQLNSAIAEKDEAKKQVISLEGELAAIRQASAASEVQADKTTTLQAALDAAQALNKKISTDLEISKKALVEKETTITQLTEQLVKMAEESLNTAVKTSKQATPEKEAPAPAPIPAPEVEAAPAPIPAPELDDTVKAALDLGSLNGGESMAEGSGVQLEGSIESGIGSEGLDGVNDLLVMALETGISSSKPQTPAASAPGSRPLSARPPSTPPPASRPPSSDPAANATAITHEAGKALPHPWEAHQDEHGNTYYYNSTTEETQWEIPQADVEGQFTESTEAFVGVTLGDEWTQMFDTSGNEYFVHHISGESVWELPEADATKYADVLKNRPASSTVASRPNTGAAAPAPAEAPAA